MNKQSQLMIPLLFVFIYGSGFVGAKLGLPYAEPFSFLSIRFVIAALILGVIALVTKSLWSGINWVWLLLSGVLLQGVFSAGVFYALALGMKPAVSALIIALQPLLVAVIGGIYLGEKVSASRWIGLLLGVIGVAIVVADGLSTEGITSLSLAWAIVSLLGVTIGQLIQKKHCASMDLFAGGFVQCLAAAVLMFILALFFETGTILWSGEFIIALTWMAVGVSIGALSLLYLMLRYSTANQVASVFYGVPVAAALVAWPLFGQIPTMTDWFGFSIVALSVIIANGVIKLRFNERLFIYNK